mmetsp:Transcript_7112/g.11808  ORF Transcript_7112/g.11808 Transcript_7112/m.11808 type:complete len:171 (-) Transcript_7112:537-1049(-)
MEALRYSILAPSAATFFMIFGCIDAMKKQIEVRYACLDDNGKKLFDHPYSPWEKVDPKYQKQADDAHRAFKTYENVKEWTFLTLPLMWMFALFGGTIPYVTDITVEVTVLVSSVVYMAANHMYTVGYMESAEKRLTGFLLRTNVAKFWMVASAVSLLTAALERFCVIGGE